MNKIYKVVWNTVRNCYVVGSELISSKSGRHSTSNGKYSSLKVTLTVLALCGMTALGSGVAPAYAADAGATTAMNQYVALKYDSSNNQNETDERINGKWQKVTTFGGQKYIKVNSGVTDSAGRPVYYWVREGYSLTMVDGQPYTSLSSNGRRADVSWTGDANAKPSDILESVTSTHVQTNVTTNVGETLQQVNAGTYAGVTNSGGTQVDGNWDYIVKDSSWKGVVSDSNYRNGYADLISNGKPKGFVRATDKGSKLAWNATLNAYTYNGKVVDYSNIYVIDGEIGVFTNASGSEVYTGTVFGKNNEVLMTVKKSDGKYYSYWGAEVNDAGATMDTYRVAEYQKDLNVLRDNDFALYHNDIKSVDMSTDTSSATISLMRNGDGTSNPAVDGTLTITNGGGTGGNDTYVRISNTTNGQEVSQTFTTGSKVEAVGSKEATTGLKINGETYNIKTGQTYTEGDNITIEGNKISATDTTLVDGKAEKKGDSYIVKDTAGNEVTLEDVASANKLTEVNNQVTENTQNITKNTTNITELGKQLKGAVMYDSTDTGFNKNNVTLGGTPYDSTTKTGGTKITNLARGTKDSDAVNFSQLSEVKDAENYVTSGSLSTTDGTITLNRLKDGPVTITGLQSYVKGLDSYVTGATLTGNTLTLARNQGLDSLTVDLSSLTKGLSKSDYRVVANPAEGSNGIYTPDDKGNIELTVEDTNTGATSTIKLSDIASATTVTNNYTTLNTKIDNTKTDITTEYNTAIDNAKTEIQDDYNTKIDAAKTHYFSVNSDEIGEGSNYNNDGAVGSYSIAVGANAYANGRLGASAFGNDAYANGESALAIGYSARAEGMDAIAIGSFNANQGAKGTNSIAIGAQADADGGAGGNASALGAYTEAGSGATALGASAKARGKNSTAVGLRAEASATNSVALGNFSSAERAADAEGVYDYVGYSAGVSLSNGEKNSTVWHANLGAVSIGNEAFATGETDEDGNLLHFQYTRQLTGLAAGTADTDAVNVAQLKKSRVELTDGTNTTVNSTNDETDGHVIYSVDVNTNGTINKGDTNIVTGDTVYNALKEVSWKAQVNGNDAKTVKKDGTLNFVNGDNIAITSTADGDIKISTKGLASSGDLWTAQAGGKDVKAVNQKVNFVGSDHITVTGTDGQIKFEATGLADTDLTNISEGGKTVINNLAKEAVKVVKGTNTTVTEGLSEDGKTKTYAVNVDNAAIQAATDVTGENGISVTSAVENGVKKYTVSAKLSNNFAIDQATGNIDLAPSISVGKTNPVTINGNTGEITGLSNKTTTAANFADGSGRAATEEQLEEVNSKATAAKTTVTAGKNIAVNGTSDENGSAYTVALADDVSLGNNAIQLKGTDGFISAKSGGAQLAFNNSGLTVSQAKDGLTNETRIDGATITVDGGAGNQTIINGSTAHIGSVLVNGGGGTATITGLTNKTTDYTGFANGSGRAATEEQLKEVAGQAGEAIETAGKGWNLTTNGKEASKTNIKPGGTVDFSSSNDNLLISNAGADLSFSLSDNLDLTKNDSKKGSVKVGENTALSNELLQVGNSSLTTSALMVGGLTYINSSGLNANNRVISNVADGILDTDAVNVGQLKSAISGSQVSIKAGDGISIAKTGNQYTINVNIEGVTNNQGKVTVSTGDSTSTESGSESGSSGAKKSQVMDLMYRTESNEVAPETTTDTGKAIQIESIPEDIKLEADDNQVASVVNGETIKIAGDGTNISTAATVTESGSMDTISVSLKPDIQVDSVTINNGGPTINSSGIDMNSQKITNLADGEIAEGSTDAVNGGQLYNTNQAVIANAENINSLSHSLNKLDSRINRVGAGAAALAALHPLDFDPDNKWDFAAGYGNYAGANAVAIGTYYRPNENTMFSIGGSFGGGENMINAGVSFKLGSGGSGITTSKTVMAKKIKEQDELLKAQDAKMKEQDEKIAKLEALVAQQGEMIQQALGKK